MEIVGSHLDYILEFGVNTAVVSRRIPISVFENLLTAQPERVVLEETIGS